MDKGAQQGHLKAQLQNSRQHAYLAPVARVGPHDQCTSAEAHRSPIVGLAPFLVEPSLSYLVVHTSLLDHCITLKTPRVQPAGPIDVFCSWQTKAFILVQSRHYLIWQNVALFL